VPIEDVALELQSELARTPAGSLSMVSGRRQAIAEFKRILKWIVLIAVLMVVGALTYLYLFSTLDLNTVIAVTLGVFFSVLLGCGLFAAAFFSNKSGIDEQVTNITRSEREKP
jgi:hypothetical protein